jgi:hypothetical protein
MAVAAPQLKNTDRERSRVRLGRQTTFWRRRAGGRAPLYAAAAVAGYIIIINGVAGTFVPPLIRIYIHNFIAFIHFVGNQTAGRVHFVICVNDLIK